MPVVFPLWPKGQTPFLPKDAPEGDNPTLTVYQPRSASGPACVVCPGGGYGTRAAHEGEPIALWLNTLGIVAGVVAYRHAPRYRHPVPVTDALQAVRLLREKSPELGADPRRVGILGFSAGGHLASSAATLFTGPEDRPDWAVLVYPVIALEGPAAHLGSKNNLLGEKADPALVKSLSTQTRVGKNTPPTYLVHTADDPVVPVQNSLLFAQALAEKNVPFGMHLMAHGPHGIGLGISRLPETLTWPAACASWLRGIQVL